jgi:hypothetical protein
MRSSGRDLSNIRNFTGADVWRFSSFLGAGRDVKKDRKCETHVETRVVLGKNRSWSASRESHDHHRNVHKLYLSLWLHRSEIKHYAKNLVPSHSRWLYIYIARRIQRSDLVSLTRIKDSPKLDIFLLMGRVLRGEGNAWLLRSQASSRSRLSNRPCGGAEQHQPFFAFLGLRLVRAQA